MKDRLAIDVPMLSFAMTTQQSVCIVFSEDLNSVSLHPGRFGVPDFNQTLGRVDIDGGLLSLLAQLGHATKAPADRTVALLESIDKTLSKIAAQPIFDTQAPVNSYGESFTDAIQNGIVRGQRGIATPGCG